MFDAERVFASHGVFHRTCFKCHECKVILDSVTACDASDGEVYCKGCYARVSGLHGYGLGRTAVAASAAHVGATVNAANAANAKQHQYHFTEFF